MDFGCLSIIVAIAFILFVGIRLITKFHDDPFAQMAGYWTLKPFVATPLFLALAFVTVAAHDVDEIQTSLARNLLDALILASPGIGLTALIVGANRKIFRSSRRGHAYLLLALDTLRWGSTVYAFAFLEEPMGVFDELTMQVAPIFALLPFFAPIIFAIATLTLSNRFSFPDEY